MRDNLMTGRNMFYVSFILLLELKNHLLNLNMNRSETAVRKVTILYHPN